RQRNRQQLCNRPGEVKAAAGDERDLGAARHCRDDRVAMGVRKLTVAVEGRAVDVDGDQSDHWELRALVLRVEALTPRMRHRVGIEVKATAPILHAPPSRTSVN